MFILSVEHSRYPEDLSKNKNGNPNDVISTHLKGSPLVNVTLQSHSQCSHQIRAYPKIVADKIQS